MPIIIQHIQLKAAEHRTAIFCTYVPNWFERWFLFRKKKELCYMGKGGRWTEIHSNKPAPPHIAIQLDQQETIFIYGGRKEYFGRKHERINGKRR